MASGQPFASRSYAGTKIPDRSVNPNAMPFSASSFSRHRGLGASAPNDFGAGDAQKQNQQPANTPAIAQGHGAAQESNPLSRLTEEQREEINEAVRRPLPLNLFRITASLAFPETQARLPALVLCPGRPSQAQRENTSFSSIDCK